MSEMIKAVSNQESIKPQKAAKLWNRDFSLLIIGKIISILGNMILTFALPLYILHISGSPALFGYIKYSATIDVTYRRHNRG